MVKRLDDPSSNLPRHTKTDIFPTHDPKPLRWLGSSLCDLRRFPASAREVAWFQLWRVQLGLDPNDWKPMASTGSGVREIRIHTRVEYRVIYTARFPEAVYVLHAFEKRARKTSARDLGIIRRRFEHLRLRKEGRA